MTRKQQTRTFSVLLMATLFQFFFSQPKTTCQNAKILYRAKEILKVDARLIYIVSSWKKEKKKNHVISKVTPKVCMLFKTAVYDGRWDKRDETVLNTLLTRCWLKKKKKGNEQENNEPKKIPIPGIYDLRMDIWMILPFFSWHPKGINFLTNLQHDTPRKKLTIMAFTISFSLFFKALIAYKKDLEGRTH